MNKIVLLLFAFVLVWLAALSFVVVNNYNSLHAYIRDVEQLAGQSGISAKKPAHMM